jgi:hypothetical protein
MKKKSSLFILIFVLSMNASQAQVICPGGVSSPVLWENTVLNKNTGTVLLQPVNENPSLRFSLTSSSRAVYLNNNPAYYIPEKTDAGLALPYEQSKQLTLFAVYQVQDTLKEKTIWHLNSGSRTRKILTTHRLADFTGGGYMNFLKGKQKTAEIHTYQLYETGSLNQDQYLRLGVNPSDINIPSENFKGIIPEVILYDRVLSSQERARVETYLAVKYGIPVYQGAEPKDYLDSSGKIIWEGGRNPAYNKRAAGIGKDDACGLFQKQSSSSLEPGIFTGEFSNPGQVPDRTYIIWADNGQELKPVKDKQGQPPGLARQWKLTSSDPAVPFKFRIDLRSVIGELPAEEYCWLALDKSGTGDFPPGRTEYLNLGKINSLQEINPASHTLSGTVSGTEVIAVRTAPSMFAQAWITQPDCGGTKPAGLSFKIEGGSAPFSVTVSGEDGFSRRLFINTNQETEYLSGLKTGTYTYKAEDSQGNTYGETLYIESYDAPRSPLKPIYTLEEGPPLTLDAGASGEPYSFLWTDENNRNLSYSPSITLSRSGTYKLKITSPEGCSSLQEIQVKSGSPGNFKNIELFPNPSIGGDFYIKIELYRVSPVQVSLYDASGRLLNQETLKGNSYYLYQGSAPAQGMYYAESAGGGDKEVKKLLVQ